MTAPDGIAASIFALVDRGVERRARRGRLQVRGEVELRFLEDLSPVRLAFADEEVIVSRTARRRRRTWWSLGACPTSWP